MKILVFSDSHGVLQYMKTAIEIENPDHVLHLGDCTKDFLDIKDQFSHIPMYNVPGNCDPSGNNPLSRLVILGGFRIFMTHGHLYQVKYMYLRAIYAALEQNAHILLFGHTHRAEYFMHGELHAMNPGAAKNGCYGVIETNHLTAQFHLKHLD